jgi:hypothetical protein
MVNMENPFGFTPAEWKLRKAVRTLVQDGIYPSPGQVEKRLGHPVRHNLNGRECRWREAELNALGFIYDYDAAADKRTARTRLAWLPPEGQFVYRDRDQKIWRIGSSVVV